MRQRFANNITTRLSQAVSPADQEIQLTAGDGMLFPALGSAEYIRISIASSLDQIEIADCTAINGDILTLIRGRENTTPLSFPAGATVYLSYTAESAQHVHNAVDDIYGKLDEKLDLTGGTMSGKLMSDGTVPSLPSEFANKHYVDTRVSDSITAFLSSYITVPGWISPFHGKARWYPPRDVIVTGCQCYQGGSPTFSPTTIDLVKNQSQSVFNGTKPSIAIGSHESSFIPANTRINTTDYLTLDVAGGTGEDLTIRFHYIPA